METCVRGFSFMSDNNVDILDLQYIQEGELERTWKNARRERMKQREQKIWEEFVREKDVVSYVCNDDPYQFLEQLPESCLKELMDIELEKMKKQTPVMNHEDPDLRHVQTSNTDDTIKDNQQTCVVTFAENEDGDSDELFHIFDDRDDEKDDEHFADEDEPVNDSLCSPDTVREADASNIDRRGGKPSCDLPTVASTTSLTNKCKSTENVSNVIESSIYCAKVKDLRQNINEEMQSMMLSLDGRAILTIDPEELPRIIKRSAEFCNRFNRIYMYQITRQMHDVKRNCTLSLPFAKHTQFQAQMVRIVSLHQNILQALQVFHKSCEQTRCVRDSAGALAALLGAARDASALCATVPAPKDFAAATELYNDELLESCNRLEDHLSEYVIRCEEYLNTFDAQNHAKKSSKQKPKKRSFVPASRNNSNRSNNIEGRLSMYSLDTLRLNLHAKPSTSGEAHTSGHSLAKRDTGNRTKPNQAEIKMDALKNMKKSPKCRRPLMRDPDAGKPNLRPKRHSGDTDVPTMVETVELEPCVSSPRTAPAHRSARAPHTGRSTAPRTSDRKSSMVRKLQPISPKTKIVRSSRVNKSEESPKLCSSLKTIASDHKDNNDLQEETDDNMLTPVSKIQCAVKKDKRDSKGGNKSGPSTYRDGPTIENLSGRRSESEKTGERQTPNASQDSCEVTKILKELCSGDATSKSERVSGAKNAKLMCVYGSSPRQPSTPQLLKILEETIQKKIPKHLINSSTPRDAERYRLTFNIPEKTADSLFQYRTKFVQHMLTSPMYANSAVGKPWEMIQNVSEQLIDEVLLSCVKDMEIQSIIEELYKRETS